MVEESPRMAPVPGKGGLLRISRPLTASAGDVWLDTPGSTNESIHDNSTVDGPSSFTINFTNIRGLSSNLPSVEHHLSSVKPNLFLLSETQLASSASPAPFNISN